MPLEIDSFLTNLDVSIYLFTNLSTRTPTQICLEKEKENHQKSGKNSSICEEERMAIVVLVVLVYLKLVMLMMKKER